MHCLLERIWVVYNLFAVLELCSGPFYNGAVKFQSKYDDSFVNLTDLGIICLKLGIRAGHRRAPPSVGSTWEEVRTGF